MSVVSSPSLMGAAIKYCAFWGQTVVRKKHRTVVLFLVVDRTRLFR